MAACKVKAMELYKPVSAETDVTREYVRNWMEVIGYRLLPQCAGGAGTFGYTYFSYYE
jgi:hypothetical protein